MRDMMSEGFLDCQGDNWKALPPLLFELETIARAAVFSDDPTYWRLLVPRLEQSLSVGGVGRQ